MREKKLHKYLYNVENWVDEFAIAFLSLGTIVVLLWAIFFSTQNVNMLSLGQLIQPWVTMTALMIIARELWLMNRNKMNERNKGMGE
ncbi:MAG: hypothetical protein ABEJ99_05795 [Candidatus Nanohaloarchaea archaeon]